MSATATRRATLIIEVHDGDADRIALEQWLLRWQPLMPHCSENLGCGCCVDIFEVEAPGQALAELPAHFIGASQWSDETLAPETPGLFGRIRNRFHGRKA